MPWYRIIEILRINYFCCFLELFSFPVQVSFSGEWKGRGIGILTRWTRQQVQHKEVSPDPFSRAAGFADVCCSSSNTGNTQPAQLALSSLQPQATAPQDNTENTNPYKNHGCFRQSSNRYWRMKQQLKNIGMKYSKWNANNFFCICLQDVSLWRGQFLYLCSYRSISKPSLEQRAKYDEYGNKVLFYFHWIIARIWNILQIHLAHKISQPWLEPIKATGTLPTLHTVLGWIL